VGSRRGTRLATLVACSLSIACGQTQESAARGKLGGLDAAREAHAPKDGGGLRDGASTHPVLEGGTGGAVGTGGGAGTDANGVIHNDAGPSTAMDASDAAIVGPPLGDAALPPGCLSIGAAPAPSLEFSGVEAAALFPLDSGILAAEWFYAPGSSTPCFQTTWHAFAASNGVVLEPGCSRAAASGNTAWVYGTALRVFDVTTTSNARTVPNAQDLFHMTSGPSDLLYTVPNKNELWYVASPSAAPVLVASLDASEGWLFLAMDGQTGYVLVDPYGDSPERIMQVDLPGGNLRLVDNLSTPQFCHVEQFIVRKGIAYFYCDVTAKPLTSLIAKPLSGAEYVVATMPFRAGHSSLAADDDFVYWAEPVGMTTEANIYRRRHCGGSKAFVANAQLFRALVVNDRAVYYNAQDMVFSVAK
jgi:hypothetical protein